MNHAKIIFGVTGQALEWYPPLTEVVTLGAPGTATFQVFAGFIGNNGTAEFSGTATRDTLALTLASASGYSQTNRNRLNLTPTGVTVGRSYLLTNAAGQREPVRVVAAGSNYADVDEPLSYDYALGDALVGLRQVLSVPDVFASNEAKINVFSVMGLETLDQFSETQTPPYRAILTYAFGSVTRTSLITFDVVRQAAKNGLTIQDLSGIVPDLLLYEWSQQRGQQFLPQLVAAERDVQIDTRLAGYDPDQIQDPELWDRIVLQKWAVTIGMGMLFTQGETPAWLSQVREEYSALFQKAIGTTCKVWVAPGSDGALVAKPMTQLWLSPR